MNVGRLEASAQAFWFGDAQHQQPAWYYPPKGEDRGCGVLLCAPFGHEYMVSYRSYRYLAAQLQSQGFAVLRFDYPGTGDSTVGHSDESFVAGCIQGVRDAAQLLREQSGCGRLLLFGLRFGGLMAATQAREVAADGLILMEPALSGRAYARELLAFARMNATGALAQDLTPLGDDEVTGYPFGAGVRSALAQLDALKALPAAGTKILLLARDDAPSFAVKLGKAYEAAQLPLTMAPATGFEALSKDDPFKAAVPHDLWQVVTDWCGTVAPTVRAPQAPNLPPQRSTVTTFSYQAVPLLESIVSFAGMTGIVSEPADPAAALKTSPVVIPNTGANHRVGPHRLNVALARTLAAKGYRVLRLDRSGFGDSPARAGEAENYIYSPLGTSDVQAAVRFMTAGAKGDQDGAVLLGLCSGAYFSYHTALVEPGVRGVVLINPLTYDWKEGDPLEAPPNKIFKSTNFYANAAKDPKVWLRALTGKVNLRGVAGILSRRAMGHVEHWREVIRTRVLRGEPDHSPVARNFLALSKRGVDVLMVLGANDLGVDCMAEHLGPGARLMARRQNFRLVLIEGSDHTFTPRWSQTHLCEVISDHVVRHHP